MPDVKLNRLEAVLDDFTYPLSREALIEECDDIVLVLAEGHEALVDILESSSEDSFASPDEVLNEVLSLLPRHAVGEPYQSEGEG